MSDFETAYEAVLRNWPGVEVAELAGPYGTTRVLSSGPPDGPPLVLLPGGGATATAWFANAPALSRVARVHAVDLPGTAGGTAVSVRDAAGLCGWLDSVLDALTSGPTTGGPTTGGPVDGGPVDDGPVADGPVADGPVADGPVADGPVADGPVADGPVGGGSVDLVGHSYGGWVALTYALHAPDRVRRLALVDPTQCFTGFRPGYLLHALPVLVRPSRRTAAALRRWETGGRALDPAWTAVADAAAEAPSTGRLVTRPKPTAQRLRALTVPTLVLLAGRGRAQDPAKAAAGARHLPDVTVEVLPTATHHSLPLDPADQVDRALLDFLGRD